MKYIIILVLVSMLVISSNGIARQIRTPSIVDQFLKSKDDGVNKIVNDIMVSKEGAKLIDDIRKALGDATVDGYRPPEEMKGLIVPAGHGYEYEVDVFISRVNNNIGVVIHGDTEPEGDSEDPSCWDRTKVITRCVIQALRECGLNIESRPITTVSEPYWYSYYYYIPEQTVKVTADYDAMSIEAAGMLINDMKRHIEEKGQVAVCFATGDTPLGLYELLRTRFKDDIDWSKVTTFNLDEYLGLGPNHIQSYYYFMYQNLFNHVPIPGENINLLNGLSQDINAECAEYEEKIAQVGGIDIAILGIGEDGHIALDSPGSSIDSRTSMVEIPDGTRGVNVHLFESKDDVPTHALTIGIATILESKKIILLASGPKKTDIIRRALTEPITLDIPASLLQNHQNTVFIIDEGAASTLP